MSDTNYAELDLDNIPEDVDLVDEEIEDSKTITSGNEGSQKHYSAKDDDVEIEYTDDDEEDEEDDDDKKSKAKADAETKAKAKEDDEKKKGRRANRRIRNLANAKNAAEAAAAEERRKRLALEERLRAVETESAKSQEQILTDRLADLKARQVTAMENANYQEASEISQAIADTNLNLQVARRRAANVPPARRGPPPQHQQQYQPQPQAPEAALNWSEDNPWFERPTTQDEAIKADAVRRIALDLVRQGNNPADEEFYEQIDEELQKYFPEKPTKSEGDEVQDHADPTPPRRQPVVGGNARGAATVRRGRRKVRLTPQDRRMIDEMGISAEEYVRNKEKADNSQGGWTEIA